MSGSETKATRVLLGSAPAARCPTAVLSDDQTVSYTQRERASNTESLKHFNNFCYCNLMLLCIWTNNFVCFVSKQTACRREAQEREHKWASNGLLFSWLRNGNNPQRSHKLGCVINKTCFYTRSNTARTTRLCFLIHTVRAS